MQNEVERIEKAEEMKELFWNLWKRNKINGLSRFDIDQFDEVVRWASNDFEAFKDVFGPDIEVCKSEAWWISAWILEKKSIQYSSKKQAWFDENGHQLPTYTIERHTPEKLTPKESNYIDNLKR